MGAPLATSTDVSVKLMRPLSALESAAADVYIREASAQVRRRIQGIDAMMVSGDVDPDLLAGVITDAVIRVLLNPSGVTSQTIALGSESATFGAAGAGRRVLLTDADFALLVPVSPGLTVDGDAVGTVRLRSPGWVRQETFGENLPSWADPGTPSGGRFI